MKRNALVYFIGTNIHRLFILITADSSNNNNNNTENDRTIIIFVEKSKHEFELAHNFSSHPTNSMSFFYPSNYLHMHTCFSGPMGPSSHRK